MIRIPSEAKISSKPTVNLASRSRIRNLTGRARWGQLKGQVPGLLDHPGSRWMGSDPGHIHLPGVQLDEEQDVQPPQEHGIHSEEVAGQHRRGLGFEELTPRRPVSVRGRVEAVTQEDVPDAGRRQDNANPRQLAVDPAIAPRRVLPGQANHHLDCPCGDARTSGGLRVGPLAPGQLTMPTKQGLGLDEEPMKLRPGDQPAEAGKERSIRWSQSRADPLPTKDGDLVPEHDDLDGQIAAVTPAQA